MVLNYNLQREDTDFTHGITPAEVMEVGAAFLMAIGTCASLGHKSPNGLIDYVARPGEETGAALVWDAFAATRLDEESKDASDRIWKYAGQRGLLEAVAEAVTR